MRIQSAGAVFIAIGLAGGAAACGNGPSAAQNKSNTPPQTQTATQSNVQMTTTVTGCLAAGEGADTFVLNAARAEGAATSATYQLVGTNNDRLRDHVGEEVKISGTVTSGEQVAASSMPQAETDKAKGTSGTPVVQTKTDVQIRRLEVSSVTPQGQKCR